MFRGGIFRDFYVVFFAGEGSQSFLGKDLVSIVDYFCDSEPIGQKMINAKTGATLFYTPRLGDYIVSKNANFMQFENSEKAFAQAISFKKEMFDLKLNSKQFLEKAKQYIYSIK